MRSDTELREACRLHSIESAGLNREQMMDALRAKIGTGSDDMQLDPMKAADLKNTIDWSLPGAERFRGLPQMNADWVLEPKLDGARMRVYLGAEKNRMNTGRRSDTHYGYTERSDNFVHLRDAATPMLEGTVLDGELMPPKASIRTHSGVVTKGTLNSAVALCNCEPAKAVWAQEHNGKAIFVAFDVVKFGGEDVTALPMRRRREILEMVMAKLGEMEPCFQLATQLEATPENAQRCLDEGFEGAMLKSLNGRYEPGKRSRQWLKLKTMSTGDFFIIGSVDGKGRNAGLVGSLQVAYKDENGFEVACADVGGYDDVLRREITGPDGKVKRELLGTVIEVMGQGSTKNGRIRHPHFVRFRPDKAAAECDKSQFDLFPEC
jgi:bifunctional non-homologous end joining protein LigD